MRHLTPVVVVALAAALLALAACVRDHRRHVVITTPYGRMRAVLYDETPLHRDNFVRLASEGYYDSLLFHRVIAGFMVQGGDPDSREARPGAIYGAGGPGYTLPAEIGAPHLRGALAAARLPGAANPGKESSGSQFYIVHGRLTPPDLLAELAAAKGLTYNDTQRELYAARGGTPQLDGDYTVFGELVEGYDVLERLATVETLPGDRPAEDVRMRVRVE